MGLAVVSVRSGPTSLTSVSMPMRCFLAICLWAASSLAVAAPTVLVMGDSLSAAYGIATDEGWVALLQRRLAEAGYPHTVVNASISGETTDGGLRRLPRQLSRHQPAVVILELGANNGLRGQPPARMRRELTEMVDAAQAAGARVLLLGMHIPPNYGPQYTQEFHDSFAQVARATGAALVPFFLEPIALDEDLFLDDRIHPNAAAQPALLDHVWPALAPLLQGADASKAAPQTN